LDRRALASLVLLSSAAISSAGVLPRQADSNTLTCPETSGCRHETIDGRVYSVLATPELVVRVSLSTEGDYTRADVSVSNNSGIRFDLLPADFRIDVVSPHPHTLESVSPASMPSASRELALQLRSRTGKRANLRVKAQPAASELYTSAVLLPPKPQPDLAVGTVLPDGTAEGKVFFLRDPGARTIHLILPISGAVFEFPFQVQ
jgi:hypothetical protein